MRALYALVEGALAQAALAHVAQCLCAPEWAALHQYWQALDQCASV